MAQTAKSGSKQTVARQRWERFKKQLVKFKGGIRGSLIIVIALHIIKIIIGSLYLHDCPIDKKIPIFLIVAGVFGAFSKILTLLKDFLIKYINVSSIVSLIGTFEFIWFICGCVWIFQVLTPSYDPISGAEYCHKTLYVFSLVYISMIFALLFLAIGMALLCLLCCCCCAGVMALLLPSDDEEEARSRPANYSHVHKSEDP